MASIKISSKNEVTIFPDFKIEAADYDNARAEKKMGFVIRKMNGMVLRDRAYETKVIDGVGIQELNTIQYVRELFVRFVNPIQLSLDGGDEKDLTLDDVINYHEFTDLLSVIFIEARSALKKGKIEAKKS